MIWYLNPTNVKGVAVLRFVSYTPRPVINNDEITLFTVVDDIYEHGGKV